MIFEVTPDNKPYIDSRGKLVLNACPGSGKTTAIAYKVSQLTKECKEKYGDFAGIACLSFTNVAKTEIAEKYHLLAGTHLTYPHQVRTLDSFVNQFVTLPFYHLFKLAVARPIIMDSVSFLDDLNLGPFLAITRQLLTKILPPSKLKFEMDGTISWKGIIPKTTTVDPLVFSKYGKTFKKWQLDKGYLNNDDSTFVAYKLLTLYPEIAKSLVRRFPYVIVDEAQDTSEIQYAIFDQLISAGLSNIEYVGDPYQSLYEFREARPDLFLSRYQDKVHWQAFQLNNCRRSSQKIINMYSIFRDPGERPIVSVCKHGHDHSVKVLHYNPKNLSDLIKRYQTLVEPNGINYILVRGATHLEMFGAKPSEDEPWKNALAITLLTSSVYFGEGKVKLAVDALRTFLANAQRSDRTYKEQRIHRDRLREDGNVNIQLFDFLRGMPSIDDTLRNWTEKITQLIHDKFSLKIDLGLKKKGKEFENRNLKALFYPISVVPFPVSTIHKVKGMTFGSVLIILSENSTGANISLKDFEPSAGLPSEKQRMIYVALSRPELRACIAVPDVISQAEIIKVLGKDVEFV